MHFANLQHNFQSLSKWVKLWVMLQKLNDYLWPLFPFLPPENTTYLWFSGVFRGYKIQTLVINWLFLDKQFSHKS